MRNSKAVPLDGLSIDRDAKEPAYRQLYRLLREEILMGSLRPNALLPSTRMLAEDLSLGRNTVVSALEQLVSEGYVEGRRRSGHFVASSLPSEKLRGKPQRRETRLVTQRIVSKRGSSLSEVRYAEDEFRPLPLSPGLPSIDSFAIGAWRRCSTKAWQSSGSDLLEPQDPLGFPPLRTAIADYLEPARGVRCKPEQVIVLTSSREGIYLAGRVLADKGDKAWIEDPGYLGARSSLQAAGLQLSPVPVDRNGIDISMIESSSDVRLAYVTPSNQYPLGGTLSLNRRLELIRWAASNGSWILEDDYDGEFRYAGHPIRALQGLDTSDRVLYIGSFNKTLFLGLRLSYIVVPEDLIAAFRAARIEMSGYAASHPQATLAEYIISGHYNHHIRRMRRLYGAQRAELLSALRSEFRGTLNVRAPGAGLHFTMTFEPSVDDRAVSSALRAEGLGPTHLSQYYLGTQKQSGLAIGFASLDRVNAAHVAKAVRVASVNAGVALGFSA